MSKYVCIQETYEGRLWSVGEIREYKEGEKPSPYFEKWQDKGPSTKDEQLKDMDKALAAVGHTRSSARGR